MWKCAGSPFVLQVVNPANRMTLHYGNATKSVPVTQTVWATINLAGYACVIEPQAIIPTVVGAYVTANFSVSFQATAITVVICKYASHAYFNLYNRSTYILVVNR